MRIRVGTLLIGLGVAAGLCVLVAVATLATPWFTGDAEPAQTAARVQKKPAPFDPLALFRSPERAKAKRARPGAAAAGVPGSADAARAANAAERASAEPKEPVLEAEDRALARADFRQERVGELNQRLDDYAETAGWEPETTERVRDLMADTTDRITKQLAAVDRGDATWEEVKPELRDFRENQAKKVRRLLGEDGFDDFVGGVGLERFLTNQPQRGRIKP